MNKNTAGVIRFLGYRITKLEYVCDASYEFAKEGEMCFRFQKSETAIGENGIQLILASNIFFGSEEDDMESSPYRLSLEIAARYESDEPWNEKWEQNALAILFPYVRAIVSSVTAQSGREPLVMPTVNIAELFKKSNEQQQ